MVHAEYIRDMHSNYMVLKGMDGFTSGYKVNILLNNIIKGILNTELRYVDEMDLFYYNITGKKSLAAKYDKSSVNYNEIKFLVHNVLSTIERSSEYLLSEDDFILDPAYIYWNSDNDMYELCYLAGYKDSLQEQLSRLIEFFMNKIDYKDEQAVVLIYALYKEVKETNCTYDKLIQLLNNKSQENDKKLAQNISSNASNEVKPMDNSMDKSIDSNQCYKQTEDGKLQRNKNNTDSKLIDKNNIKQNMKPLGKNGIQNAKPFSKTRTQNSILFSKNETRNSNSFWKNGTHNIKLFFKNSIQNIKLNQKNKYKKNKYQNKKTYGKNTNQYVKPFLEEIDNDREVYYYNPILFLIAGILVLIGCGVIAIAIHLKLLHNSFGTSLDMIKVLCCFIIVGLIETYIMLQLFDKKNRNTKTVTDIEYLEPDIDLKDNLELENNLDLEKNKLTKARNWNDEQDNITAEEKNKTTQVLWMRDEEEEKTKILLTFSSDKKTVYELFNPFDNTIVLINTFPFVIGKMINAVDLTIEEDSVSRFHAKITQEEDDVYLTDLGSTNGTFVNEIKLIEHKPYLLTHKDEIIFSNVKYTWRKTEY